MNTLGRIGNYGERHHPLWIDFIRIILGIAFFIKGLQFLLDPSAGLGDAQRVFLSISAMHYIVFAHLVGGLFIMLGLVTRLAVLIQLPILVWALLASGSAMGIYYAGWIYTVTLLLLSILILIFGSGPLSVDRYWKKHPNA